MTSSHAEHIARMRADSVLELNLLRQETLSMAAQSTQYDAANEGVWTIERAGVRCAGVHMIIDFHGARRLDEPVLIEHTSRRCVEAAGATLLHLHQHRFGPGGGIGGVAVLAEGHISTHSWPQQNYAAFDIFMSGKARPERCIEVLLEAFSPRRAEIQELLRGAAR